MSLTGFDKLQTAWSKSAVADAARAAATSAQRESRDSRATGTSDNFLFHPMNQWSRDTGSEMSLPPPPPEESRGSRRFSNSSGAPFAQLIQQGAAIEQGMRSVLHVAAEGVPEEVPIGHHGMQRGVLRSVPEGAEPDPTSPSSGVQQASSSLQAAPWLHGRMRLPTPRGFDDGDPPSEPPQAVLPPPPPMGQDNYSQNYSRWRDTINYMSVPIRPPDLNDSRESRSSFYDSWMPWRQSRQQAHSEETASFREDNPFAAERARYEEQWQTEHQDLAEDLTARTWESAEQRLSRQSADHRLSRQSADQQLSRQSADQRLSRHSADQQLSRQSAEQRLSRQQSPYDASVPPVQDILNAEQRQSQTPAFAEESTPFAEHPRSSRSQQQEESRQSWQRAPSEQHEESFNARSREPEDPRASWHRNVSETSVPWELRDTREREQRSTSGSFVPVREEALDSRSQEHEEQRRSSTRSYGFQEQRPSQMRNHPENIAFREDPTNVSAWEVEIIRQSEQQFTADGVLPSREEDLSARAHGREERSWRESPRIAEDSQSAHPPAIHHLPPAPEVGQAKAEVTPAHIEVHEVDTHVEGDPINSTQVHSAAMNSPRVYSAALLQHEAPAGHSLTIAGRTSELKSALRSSAVRSSAIRLPADVSAASKRGSRVSFKSEDTFLDIVEEPEPENENVAEIGHPRVSNKRSWRPWPSEQRKTSIVAFKMEQAEAKRFSKSAQRSSHMSGGSQGPQPIASKGSLLSLKTTGTTKSMFTKKLNPQWKEMLQHATSFKATALQEVVGGKLRGSQSTSSKAYAEKPKFTDCLRNCCSSLFEIDAPLLVPACALILSLTFAVGLCGFLWSAEVPDLYAGAFGLITQTDRPHAVQYKYFEKAREHAIASLSTIITHHNDDLFTEGDETVIDYVNNTWAWRHVEIIYTRTGGNLLEKVFDMKTIESQLRDLPGWVSLCEKVPANVRHYCNPGDSFAAVLFGTDTRADVKARAMGALNQVIFDGQSGNTIMPLSQFIQFLKDFEEVHLKRWFADTGPKLADSPLRTTFAFYLSDDNFQEWDVFVNDELEPLLYELATAGDGEHGDGSSDDEELGNPIRVFYRADGLDTHKEFVRAAAEDIPLRAVAPFGVLLAVFLTSRRLLLAVTAAVLSVTTPLTSSTLLAGRGATGKLEYPATTVAAWCIVSVTCCELALATANAWAMEDAAPMLPSWLRQRRYGITCLPGWNITYRSVRFLLEVPAPCLVPAFALFICSFVVDLPLVTEFTLHTSLGLISACIFSVLIFPPACEIGNKMAESAKESEFMNHYLKGRFGSFLPYECGAEPQFLEKIGGLAEHLISALSSKTVRTFAFFVTLAVVIGACFQETSPRFIPDTPELFQEGHRLRIAPKVRELFGSGELMAGTGAPDQTFRSARKCTPDCYDSLDCSWYKCEVDEKTQLDEGQCTCHKQLSGEPAEIRSCGAVARFTALPPGSDAFAKVTFWRWVEETLGVLIVNTSLSMFPMGVLEMESWATGLVTTENQMVVKSHGSDGQAPAWEDACLRVLCYCGPSQCLLDRSWSSFGNIEISAPDRRLQVTPSQSQLTLTNVVRSSANEVEIYMVFGLKNTTFIPRKHVEPDLEFDNFVIESPWVQRHVYRYCAGISPHLNINRHRCWIMDFRRWLEGNGERFPIPAESFYAKFHSFLTHAAYLKSLELGRDYDYFWLSSTGKVKGCYAVFNGNYDDKLSFESYMLKWSMYMYRRRYMFPAVAEVGQPWIVSPQFNAYSAASAVKEAAKNAVSLSFVFLTLVTLILTCSPGLTVAIVLIEAVTLGILVGIGVGLGRRDFGAMEVCGLAIFMSGLITPLIRVAHQYTLARDGPGDPPPTKPPDGTDSDEMRQFRPRSRSMTGDMLQLQDGPGSPISSHSKHPAEGEVEEYLVDNSVLQARTVGLAYRMSPKINDIDKKSRGHQGVAQWGTTVAGVIHKRDWIRVGNRFLPIRLKGVTVLLWQEREKPPEPERVFSPEPSEIDYGTCMEELKASLFGPYDVVKIFRGAPFEERKRRSLTAVKRSSQIVIGASIAGSFAGVAMVHMCMEALGRIGLAALCAAVTAPTAALGLLPMLAMVPFTGPSRVRRRAFAEFAQWVFKRMPRGSQSSSDAEPLEVCPSCGEELGEGACFCEKCGKRVSQLGMERPDSSSAKDSPNIGEMAAEVLGLPFSLTVKNLGEHVPASYQWTIEYVPASLQWLIGNRSPERLDGVTEAEAPRPEV